MHMFNTQIIETPIFWLWISFILFIFFIGRPVWKIILKMIDSESNSISKKLENSKKELKEAETVLNKIRKEKEIISEQTEVIIQKAKKEKKQIEEETQKVINEIFKREEKRLAESIQKIENKSKIKLQTKAATISIKITKEILKQLMSKEEHRKALNQKILENIKNIKQ